MRLIIKNFLGFIMLGVLGLGLKIFAAGPDFIIETPNGQFNYRVNGVDGNPDITLLRGHTYTFLVSNTAAFHPVAMADSPFGNALSGVAGAPTDNGLITYSVPADAVDGVYYCAFHGFGGVLKVVDPPVPVIQIVGLNVGSNITVTSTISSTNGLTIVPEFKTNLYSTNWFALTVRTNRFASGTNDVICGKPAGDSVFIRIRANQN